MLQNQKEPRMSAEGCMLLFCFQFLVEKSMYIRTVYTHNREPSGRNCCRVHRFIWQWRPGAGNRRHRRTGNETTNTGNRRRTYRCTSRVCSPHWPCCSRTLVFSQVFRSKPLQTDRIMVFDRFTVCLIELEPTRNNFRPAQSALDWGWMISPVWLWQMVVSDGLNVSHSVPSTQSGW